MLQPKFWIGPMTKNVIDAIIDFTQMTQQPIGIIPSRRQIEFNKGYVNNWSTEEFFGYVKPHKTSLVICRDHSGPGQGLLDDDGYESLKEDCKYFDLIHIDPWKKYQDFQLGLKHTIEMIKFCFDLNPNIKFEIGTEESIKYFSPSDLQELVSQLKSNLSTQEFSNIKYLVIQSGTSLKGNSNMGQFDKERLNQMVTITKKFNLLSKEHNGDYIPIELIKQKFNLGLDSINIAPEFGLIETQTYLDNIDTEKFELFFELCLKSNRWQKWVNDDFKPYENKLDLIKICGHYVLSTNEFQTNIKSKLIHIDSLIKNNIIRKLYSLHGLTT